MYIFFTISGNICIVICRVGRVMFIYYTQSGNICIVIG
jgi:hypothetical protein